MVTGFSIGITQNSQNAEKNTSNVTVSLTITWNGGSYNATGNAAGVLNVDGTDYSFTAKFNTAQKNSGSEVIFSKTLDIPHSTDGNKSLSCSASFATGTGVGTVTASATKTLTQIPRESTIGASDADIGAISIISVAKKNTAYNHSIAFAFGNLSGYLADAAGTLSDSEVKLSATCISFPIPESFYGQIPDAPYGYCTLTVRTYSGSTQIGSAKTCSFKVTAVEENCRPKVSATVTDVNPKTLALTGNAQVFVRGRSTALCTMEGEPQKEAGLVSRTIGGAAVTESQREIRNVETSNVVFTATDSRGYTGTHSVPLTMIAYVPLTCNATVRRVDPTSGKAALDINGKCFTGSFGAEENTLTVRYKIGSGDYVDLVPQIEGNSYKILTEEIADLDYRSIHDITVEVFDKLDTQTKPLTLGKGVPVFDWGEQDFTFHVPVNANGVFMSGQYVDGVNLLSIQSELSCFDGTGKGRQTFFITGCANGLPVHGLIGVWLKNGNTFISGTGISSATSDNEKGQVNVVFDTTPWDTLTVISNKPFTFVKEKNDV